jgi:hypothetical protein
VGAQCLIDAVLEGGALEFHFFDFHSGTSSRSVTFLLLVGLGTAHLHSMASRIFQFIELFQKFPVPVHDAHLAAYRT